MADLLPSLSSDEEGNAERTEDEGADDMDEGFVFGGILGEDGGSSFAENSGWSFRPDRGAPEKGLPHMQLSDLIAAKRKAIISAKAATKQVHTPIDDEKNKGNEEKNETSMDVKDTNNASSSSSSSSSSEDDSSEDGEFDENEDTPNKDLEGDVLKHRAGKDDGEDSVSTSSDEADDAAEQAKAADYFQDEETPVTDRVFTELALSRPLLRGVAAMGFVQPTPIQSSVIPLALQGRDVCASAQTGSGKVRMMHGVLICIFCLTQT